jgi:hypothetical protein
MWKWMKNSEGQTFAAIRANRSPTIEQLSLDVGSYQKSKDEQ